MAQGVKAAPDFAEDLGSWVCFPTPTLDKLQLLVITSSGNLLLFSDPHGYQDNPE